MGDELFDPWFNESDIDLMRHGYDVPHTCFRAGWDLAQERIAELEEIIEEWREERDSVREEREQLKAENQRLRAKIADWQDRFTEGLLYDEDNNQTVLVWTQREIDQAKSEADELCRKLGIALEVET